MAAVCRDSARYAVCFTGIRERRKEERERETSSIVPRSFEAVIQNEGGRDGGASNNPSTFFEDNPLLLSFRSSSWCLLTENKQRPLPLRVFRASTPVKTELGRGGRRRGMGEFQGNCVSTQSRRIVKAGTTATFLSALNSFPLA